MGRDFSITSSSLFGLFQSTRPRGARHPETRKVYAVDEEGNTLLSENKIGAVASFEEALELLIKRDPDRDRILKPTGVAGGGMQRNGKGITNADEAYLNDPKVSPVDKQNFLRKRQLA